MQLTDFYLADKKALQNQGNLWDFIGNVLNKKGKI